MSKAQSDAVKARIQTYPLVATKTFKSIVDHGTLPPYVVIHGAPGTDTQERFTGGRTTSNPRYTLHLVGVDADQVEVMTDRLKAKFIANGLGIPLSVPGETCRSLWWSAPVPIQVSTDPLPQMAWQVVELGWTAEPA